LLPSLKTTFKLESIFCKYKDVLKGQANLAQGITLGLELGKKIVREQTVFNEEILFRTKRIVRFLIDYTEAQFRPQEGYRIDYLMLSDGFCFFIA
jgi:hypothetical protein